MGNQIPQFCERLLPSLMRAEGMTERNLRKAYWTSYSPPHQSGFLFIGFGCPLIGCIRALA